MTLEKSKFAITTPLYYVNDLPHIGSAYTTMAADVVARFKRLQGLEVLLITGTDEHGQKIERTAINKGVAPQDHCDQIANGFANLWQLLDIKYDRFIRTTASVHRAIVYQFWDRVSQKGDIYLGQQQGWYCVACEEFKDERELLEDHHCPLHPNIQVEWRDERNYFFRLSKYQTQLEKLYKENPSFINPVARRNEVLKFIAQGLQDFSISRINVAWGFPVPDDQTQTIYVWFDALLGYISALLNPEEEPTLEKALGKYWPINIHLIGKDILRFHAIYWPAMLMSADLAIPTQIFGHGFLTKEGRKISKTLGNIIDPIDLVQKYGSDAIRYYFLKEIDFGSDGDFNESRFVNIINADLADNLGNLLNRTLKMAYKYCDGKVPSGNELSLIENTALKEMGANLSQCISKFYLNLEFSQACNEILKLIQSCNKMIDDQAPWTLYKKGEQEKVKQVLYFVLESVRLAAYLLSPVIPKISTDIYRQLGFNLDFNRLDSIYDLSFFNTHSTWGFLPIDQPLGDPQPIFTKLQISS